MCHSCANKTVIAVLDTAIRCKITIDYRGKPDNDIKI